MRRSDGSGDRGRYCNTGGDTYAEEACFSIPFRIFGSNKYPITFVTRHDQSHESQGPGGSTPANGDTYTGDMTYSAPGLGACGHINYENEDICAVSHVIYDRASNSANPNTNPLCGHTLKATHRDSQGNTYKSIVLTVVDRCEACAAHDIDLSPGAFEQLEDLAVGRAKVIWEWLPPVPDV